MKFLLPSWRDPSALGITEKAHGAGNAEVEVPWDFLLVAMLGEHAPMDVWPGARRLRAEGTAALAIDGDIAGLEQGLVFSEMSRSPSVLDVLPPLFWLEAQWEDGSGARGVVFP